MRTVTLYVILSPITVVVFLLWLSAAVFIIILRGLFEIMTYPASQAKGKRHAREILLKF